MKRKHDLQFLSLCIMAIVLSAASGYGQTDVPKAKNSLKEDVWALQFGVGSDFRLTAFQGAVLSAKRQYSNGTCIRIGVSGSFDFRKTEYTQFDSTGPLPGATAGPGNSQSISLTVQYLIYPNPEGEFNLYYGAGPIVSFGRGYFESRNSLSMTYQTSEQTTLGIGASAVIGVEWFAAHDFSLHAEYGATLMYSFDKRSDKTLRVAGDGLIQGADSKNWTWRFGGNSVFFGLSVYL